MCNVILRHCHNSNCREEDGLTCNCTEWTKHRLLGTSLLSRCIRQPNPFDAGFSRRLSTKMGVCFAAFRLVKLQHYDWTHGCKLAKLHCSTLSWTDSTSNGTREARLHQYLALQPSPTPMPRHLHLRRVFQHLIAGRAG